MKIDIINKQSCIRISKKQVIALVKTVIAFEQKTCDEVAIFFVDPQEISELHAEFFNDPTPTDCISFPMEKDPYSNYHILGDVFVCPEIAMKYAKSHELNPYEEVSLYTVHGLLHLMGYDDLNKKDLTKMRAAEARHMKNLHTLGYCLRSTKNFHKSTRS